jgi:uncharacterized phage-associated protein
MVTIFDVARHILDRLGPMEAEKLHCLLYYCQAWHLAFHGKPLFDSDFIKVDDDFWKRNASGTE